MPDAAKPIPHSYWVEPGKFLAGEYPRDLDGPGRFDKLRDLESAGVTLFVDLTEAGELRPYADRLQSAAHRRFGIRDSGIPETPELTAAILDAIDDGINDGGINNVGNDSSGGGVVYLHCWGGVGRTGTIVGCWLARQGLSGDEALARLAELWRQCPKSQWRDSPENPWQRNYVRQWREPR